MSQTRFDLEQSDSFGRSVTESLLFGLLDINGDTYARGRRTEGCLRKLSINKADIANMLVAVDKTARDPVPPQPTQATVG